jgi:hypothetical protein
MFALMTQFSLAGRNQETFLLKRYVAVPVEFSHEMLHMEWITLIYQ